MKKIWIKWSLSLLLVIAASFINTKFFRIKNILAIEFATSPDSMHCYISHISPPLTLELAYQRLVQNTLTDYVFIIAYTLLTIFSFRIMMDALETEMPSWIFILAVVPGVFDAIENVFLLRTGIRQHETLSWVYDWAVRIKWGFSIVPCMLVTIVIIYGLVLLFRARQAA